MLYCVGFASMMLFPVVILMAGHPDADISDPVEIMKMMTNPWESSVELHGMFLDGMEQGYAWAWMIISCVQLTALHVVGFSLGLMNILIAIITNKYGEFEK